MNAAAAWRVDQTKILTRTEITTVIEDLKRRGRRSVNSRMNLIIFRLATCCGLRASELCELHVGDVRVNVARPYVNIRATVAKGGRARRVPLWWDRSTLDDLSAWKDERLAQGAKAGSPFVCGQSSAALGHRLTRQSARNRFKVGCRALGEERCHDLTIHDGRHSFVSHSLAGGRTLAEVRDAAGHANIATTSVYTHTAVDDDGEVGDLFGFS